MLLVAFCYINTHYPSAALSPTHARQNGHPHYFLCANLRQPDVQRAGVGEQSSGLMLTVTCVLAFRLNVSLISKKNNKKGQNDSPVNYFFKAVIVKRKCYAVILP